MGIGVLGGGASWPVFREPRPALRERAVAAEARTENVSPPFQRQESSIVSVNDISHAGEGTDTVMQSAPWALLDNQCQSGGVRQRAGSGGHSDGIGARECACEWRWRWRWRGATTTATNRLQHQEKNEPG